MRALRWQSRGIRDQHSTVPHLSPTPLDVQLSKVSAVATARGLNAAEAKNGYKHSTVVAEVGQQTNLGIELVWKLTSGLAHGRLFAYLGMLQQARTPTQDPDVLHVGLTSDHARALYPVLTTVRLMEALLVLWEQRAGYR